MALTRNQKTIIDFAKGNNGMITKKQAVELLDRFYHCNGAFHIGNSLSAMVNSGVLQRVKRGEFKLLQMPTSKPVKTAENQLNFF